MRLVDDMLRLPLRAADAVEKEKIARETIVRQGAPPGERMMN